MTDTSHPGTLRTAIRLFRGCLRQDALLRQGLFAFILFSVCASIASVTFGLGLPLGGPKLQSITPTLFGVLLVPLQFLIFDRMLGHAAPRTTWRALCLDLRLARMLWAWLKYVAAVALPLLLTLGIVALAAFSLPKSILPLVLIPVILVMVPTMFYLIVRLFYLPIIVAQGRRRELRSALAETRGRFWAIVRSVFLAYLALSAVSIPVSLLTEWLIANAPLWCAAGGILLDGCVTAPINGLSAAVLAVSYRMVVLEGGATGADAPAAGPANGPDFTLHRDEPRQ
jgi:hypothetical protein